jgi:hypothetical protein
MSAAVETRQLQDSAALTSWPSADALRNLAWGHSQHCGLDVSSSQRP